MGLTRINNDYSVGQVVTLEDGSKYVVEAVTLVDQSGNPVGGGSGAQAYYNATLPTNTNDTASNLQVTQRGALISSISTPMGSPVGTSAPVRGTSSSNVGLATLGFNLLHNGSSWDPMFKPNGADRVASSAAAGNPKTAKASAGEISQFWGQNGATATFLQIYDKASLPVIGTDTPKFTFPIPASTVFSQTIGNGGFYCASGISFAFTTDAAGTTAAAAGAVTAFALLFS